MNNPLYIKDCKDLNNMFVKVKVDNKTYIGRIYIGEKYSSLVINMSNRIEHWENISEYYKCITGHIMYDDTPISFIDCNHARSPIYKDDRYNLNQVEFYIDRILLGYKISDIRRKNINAAYVDYDNIDCFTNDSPYKYDYKSNQYEVSPSEYTINTKLGTINIEFSCRLENPKDFLNVSRMSIVHFDLTKKVSLYEIIAEIYKLRSFFMLILKKHVVITRQTLCINGNKYELFDCNSEIPYLYNQKILDRKSIKIENISNINLVYQNFNDNYQLLFPALDIYFHLISCYNPNLTRFIMGTTAIEYISDNLYPTQAKELSKKERKNKINFVHKVASLINNVNEIFRYNDSELSIVSQNVTDARVYYVHYNKSRKSLIGQQQMYYSYFVLDLILLNIYLYIGFDLKLFENSNYNSFYYFSRDITK